MLLLPINIRAMTLASPFFGKCLSSDASNVFDSVDKILERNEPGGKVQGHLRVQILFYEGPG